jgi:phosphatidate cytidylyltransferase
MTEATEVSLPAGRSALRQRTWTALILGPLVLGAVLWLPAPGFALFLALVVLIGAWEWAGLIGVASVASRTAYLAVAGLVLGVLWFQPQWRPWIVGIGAAWWVIQAVVLTRVRTIAPRHALDGAGAVTGLLVLGAPWAALLELRSTAATGPALVLFLFLLIWIADSAAYFVGRRWGHAKLAPVLSPGKTRAGVYGALIGAGAGGLLLSYALALDIRGTVLAALVCVLTVVMSVVGDLYESLPKRRRGVKDSGHLLPGHGGLLDRIDSLTAAAPVFTLGLSLLRLVNP